MSVDIAPSSALERNWWLRVGAVLVSPRAIFVSLRDDSESALEARQEALSALAGLAGMAGVLAAPIARQILNDGSSPIIVPIWVFFGGMFYAFALYWLGGGLLFGAARRLGGLGSWQRARHTLALAATPLALSLLVFWPVRIAVYGEDLFRTGGDDYGRGDTIFGAVFLGFAAWSIWLLLVGVRAVHGWSWPRSAATVALAAAFPVLIVLATSL
jgi:hypothetical protein